MNFQEEILVEVSMIKPIVYHSIEEKKPLEEKLFASVPNEKRASASQALKLKAVILALKEVASIDVSYRVTRIVVFTDSRYVVDNYPRAIVWSKNKWLTQSGGGIVAPTSNNAVGLANVERPAGE